ncbi:MAG TPA: VWA domain-containing protein [Vicinamibacterales bacterium]|nr:VWA domain-containing protein [Vicinamibacterales bacterium]
MNKRPCILFAALLGIQPPPQPQPFFSSSVEVVAIDVSVVRGNQPVQGLTSHDFALTDNGVAQQVESVTIDRLPLNVTLILDSSLSLIGDRLTHLVQAGGALTSSLRPDDRAALITFSHHVALTVPMTTDRQAIRSALTRLEASGSTALRDAVHFAIQLDPRDRARSLLLVFTDGHDTASWLTEEAVLDTVRRSGAVIHAVRVESDSFLDRLTQAAGGRTWSATSGRQLRELFTRALDEMRARYLLTYTPRGVDTAGWHSVKVSLKNSRGEITARPGYSR